MKTTNPFKTKDQSFLVNPFVAISFCILIVIVSQISVFSIPNGSENILIFSLSQFLFLFLSSFAILHYLRFSGNNEELKSIKLNKSHFIVFLLIIILTQLTGFVLINVLEILLPIDIMKVIEERYEEIEEMQKYLVSFKYNNPFIVIFAVSITPAICEEYLFRGYLQRVLKENFSTNKAIILTSLIFSAIHIDFISFLGIFLLSCVIGFYKEKTNSLKIPIFIHFLNNFISIMLYNGFTFFEIDF